MTITTRVLRDGRKRYDAVWRVNGKTNWKSFGRRQDAEHFLAESVKAAHVGTYQQMPRSTPQRVLAHDLLVDLKLLSNSRSERLFLDRAGIQEFLSIVDSLRDRTIVIVAICSGLRRGEIFALRWSDVDWDAKQIRRPEQCLIRHSPYVKDAKLRASRRRVALSTRMLTHLP